MSIAAPDPHAFAFSRLHRVTRKSPIKYVWLAAQLLSVLALAPAWAVQTLVFGAPRRSWSLGVALRVRALRWISSILTSTGLPAARRLSDDPKPESLRRTTLLRAPAFDMSRLEHGFAYDMAQLANVTSTSVPAFVYTRDRSGLPTGENQQIILFAHGGAYVVGDATENHTGAAICFGLLEHTKVAAGVSVDYRLTTSEPFPAALLDALSVYTALVEQHGIKPDRIVLSGDSAGGHLMLSLARLLRDERPAPSPRGLVLFSPGWLDIRPEHEGAGSLSRNYHSDILPRGLGGYARSLFLKGLPLEALDSPYVCPNAGPTESFIDFPSTLIVSGDAECLRDDIRELAARMEQSDVEVSLHEYRDMIHDFCTWTWMRERVPALRDVGRWLAAL